MNYVNDKQLKTLIICWAIIMAGIFLCLFVVPELC